MEKVEGAPTVDAKWTTLERDTAIKRMAELYCGLASVPFKGVGSLTVDGTGSVSVGPYFGSIKAVPFTEGPYRSSQAAYLSLIRAEMSGLENGTQPLSLSAAEERYLELLEMRELVAGCAEMGHEEEDTFIRHGDDNPNQLFMPADGSGRLVLLDWEL